MEYLLKTLCVYICVSVGIKCIWLCICVHVHLYCVYMYMCTCIVHMRSGALVHMCKIKWCLSGKCSAILYISRTGRAAKQRGVATCPWRNILPLVYSVWQRDAIEWDCFLCVHRIQNDILRTIILFGNFLRQYYLSIHVQSRFGKYDFWFSSMQKLLLKGRLFRGVAET